MQVIYIIFMVLWVTGLLTVFVTPVISFVSNGLEIVVAKIFSLFV